MLKSLYDNLEAIPEGERQHYVKQEDGKFVLQLDDQHPTLVKNKELLREKSADKGTITRLTNEKATLEATVLPAGHVAVPAADAQLLDSYRVHGKPDEISSALKERDTLKTKAAEMDRKELLRSVLEAEGWTALDVLATASGTDAIEIKEVEEDGAKVKRAFVNVTDTEGKTQSVAARERYAPFLPALQPEGDTSSGTPYLPQVRGKDTKPMNPALAYLNKVYAPRQAATQ